MTEAYVHFKNGRVWKFEEQPGRSFLCHTTRYSTLYAIITCLSAIKPIWIGRYYEEDRCWLSVESYLGAEYVEFCLGQRYYFNPPETGKVKK